MSDKELRLLAEARREAGARRGGAAPGPIARPVPARAAPVGAAPMSPLDGQTVVGWDSPAANASPVVGKDAPAARGAAEGKGADEKWARIAALMESERAEALQKRRRAQRRVKYFLGALLVIAALVAARVLLGR